MVRCSLGREGPRQPEDTEDDEWHPSSVMQQDESCDRRVMVPPSRPPLRKAPGAVDRSDRRFQRLKADAIAGESAASSAPNVKRIPILTESI